MHNRSAQISILISVNEKKRS